MDNELDVAVDKAVEKNVLLRQLGGIIGKLIIVAVFLAVGKPESFSEGLFVGVVAYSILTITSFFAHLVGNWLLGFIILIALCIGITQIDISKEAQDGIAYVAMAVVILLDLIRIIRLVKISAKKKDGSTTTITQKSKSDSEPTKSQFDLFSGCNDIESLDEKFKALRKMYDPENGTADEENLKRLEEAYIESYNNLCDKIENKA